MQYLQQDQRIRYWTIICDFLIIGFIFFIGNDWIENKLNEYMMDTFILKLYSLNNIIYLLGSIFCLIVISNKKTVYIVSDTNIKEIILTRFGTERHQTPLDTIYDITITSDCIEKWLSLKTITLYTIDSTHPILYLQSVSINEELYNKLEAQVLHNKKTRDFAAYLKSKSLDSMKFFDFKKE